MPLNYPRLPGGTPMTPPAAVSDELAAARVVPVVTRLAPGDALALAAALVRGGLSVIEVTLRAAGAIESIAAIAADPPEGMLVGAGTVLTADQVDAAVDAGARFVVSPGLSARVVARCAARGVPCIPGVVTATEVMAALDEGLDLLKFFPAEAAGGVTTLRALAAPFPQARWVPTGGITRRQPRGLPRPAGGDRRRRFLDGEAGAHRGGPLR